MTSSQARSYDLLFSLDSIFKTTRRFPKVLYTRHGQIVSYNYWFGAKKSVIFHLKQNLPCLGNSLSGYANTPVNSKLHVEDTQVRGFPGLPAVDQVPMQVLQTFRGYFICFSPKSRKTKHTLNVCVLSPVLLYCILQNNIDGSVALNFY